jgi:hypothetical protein
MATNRPNCIRCLTIVETLFLLVRELKVVQIHYNDDSLLKDRLTTFAIRDICNIISGMERDSNLALEIQRVELATLQKL